MPTPPTASSCVQGRPDGAASPVYVSVVDGMYIAYRKASTKPWPTAAKQSGYADSLTADDAREFARQLLWAADRLEGKL